MKSSTKSRFFATYSRFGFTKDIERKDALIWSTKRLLFGDVDKFILKLVEPKIPSVNIWFLVLGEVSEAFDT